MAKMSLNKKKSPRVKILTTVGKNKKPVSRREIANSNWEKARNKFNGRIKFSKATKKKIKKIALLLVGLFLILATLGGLWFFSYLQELSDDLPSLDDPFKNKEFSSIIYDRNGVELYKVIGKYNRDPFSIDEVPQLVKWAFLAAEDIDFYSHQGFDPLAILRCGWAFVRSGGQISCGGSTITQQVVKITTPIGGERSFERKIRELLMAIKLEQAYSKDEILQLYLTVAPFGSNITGLRTAAEFYFDKDINDLTLEEAATLASIVQDPLRLSPTVSVIDKEEALSRLHTRQMYVLNEQMRTYMDKINSQTRINLDDPEADDVLTQEMLEEAIANLETMEYSAPIATDMKAGHFVRYALDLLQQRNYKHGEEPFTLADLQNGGYRIYTTLDYDLQRVAESSVLDAANSSGPVYGFSNAALMTLQPSTGQILTMVGSKNWYGTSEGCDANGKNCRFDPEVNIMNTRQSPGSSTKPFAVYENYRQGLLFPGGFLPDIPIEVGGGYSIKNWNGEYIGVNDQTTVQQMLRSSRNLPAIIYLENIGISRFLELMRSFGYTTYGDDSQYGPSVVLGGADVIPIEHAQGYGVFANGGDLVTHEVILKITDKDGNTIYEAKPERKSVADPQAVYLLNDTMKNNHSVSWDDRDVSSKSGTSEENKDAWIVMWSPDFVTLGWVGNNNNAPTTYSTFGENAVVPWLKNYMRQIGNTSYFAARTSFSRPGGITEGGGCGNPDPAQCIGEFQGVVSGLMIEGRTVPVDNIRTKVRVCSDQPDRLARPIDEALGLAQDAVVVKYLLPASPHLQHFLDEYMQAQADAGKGVPNGGPNKPCDKDRSGSGASTWIQTLSGTVTGSSINIKGSAFSASSTVTSVDIYFDRSTPGGTPIGSISSNFENFDVTYSLPAGVEPGEYTIVARVTDANSVTNTKTAQVVVGSTTNSSLNVTRVPTNGTATPNPLTWGTHIGSGISQTVEVTWSGVGTLSSVQLYVQLNGGALQLIGNMTFGGPCNPGMYCMVPGWGSSIPMPTTTATYKFYAVANIGNTGILRSAGSSDVIVN